MALLQVCGAASGRAVHHEHDPTTVARYFARCSRAGGDDGGDDEVAWVQLQTTAVAPARGVLAPNCPLTHRRGLVAPPNPRA